MATRTEIVGFRGELLRPGDDGYDQARRLWNGAIDKRPALIARCAGAADVRAGIEHVQASGLPLAVRGGSASWPRCGGSPRRCWTWSPSSLCPPPGDLRRHRAPRAPLLLAVPPPGRPRRRGDRHPGRPRLGAPLALVVHDPVPARRGGSPPPRGGDRLQWPLRGYALKQAWDPHNLFRLNQNVTPGRTG